MDVAYTANLTLYMTARAGDLTRPETLSLSIQMGVTGHAYIKNPRFFQGSDLLP